MTPTDEQAVIRAAEKLGMKYDARFKSILIDEMFCPTDATSTHQLLMLAIMERERWGVRYTKNFYPLGDAAIILPFEKEWVEVADLPLAVIRAFLDKHKEG